MKIRITNTNSDGGNKPNPLYAAWGNQAQNAISQGWYAPDKPDINGAVVYRSPYFQAFNNVVIPNQKQFGHIALIGHPNQTFDIAIRDANNNVQSYIKQGISPDQVQQYITSNNSTVAQRNNKVIAGTNSDKRNPDGSYVALNK